MIRTVLILFCMGFRAVGNWKDALWFFSPTCTVILSYVLLLLYLLVTQSAPICVGILLHNRIYQESTLRAEPQTKSIFDRQGSLVTMIEEGTAILFVHSSRDLIYSQNEIRERVREDESIGMVVINRTRKNEILPKYDEKETESNEFQNHDTRTRHCRIITLHTH